MLSEREPFEWRTEEAFAHGNYSRGVTWVEGQQFGHSKRHGHAFVALCGIVLVLTGFVTMVAELPLVSWPAYALGFYTIYLAWVPTPTRTILFTSDGNTETPNGLSTGPRRVRVLPTFNVRDISSIEVNTIRRNRWLPYDSGAIRLITFDGHSKTVAVRLTSDEAMLVARQLTLALDAVREMTVDMAEEPAEADGVVFSDRFGRTSI